MTLPDVYYPTFSQTFALSGDYRFTTEPVPSHTANTLPTEVITGLVDFLPRVPMGFTWYLDNFPVIGNNEVQVIGFAGTPTAGTFKLGYPATSPVWTSALPYTLTFGDGPTIQAALEGLPGIGAGNVSVTDDMSSLGLWNVEFINALGNRPVDMIQMDTASLTNATGGGLRLLAGHTVVNRDTAMAMDPVFNARIWEGQLCTIDIVDTPGFHLPAATDEVLQAIAALDPQLRQQMQMPDDKLLYDVRHRSVVFADAEQALQDYAIAALAPGETMILTSGELERLPYLPRPNAPAA